MWTLLLCKILCRGVAEAPARSVVRGETGGVLGALMLHEGPLGPAVYRRVLTATSTGRGAELVSA